MIQSCPGTIQLANELASGMSVQSTACAMLGKAMNTYGDHMTTTAQEELTNGQKMTATADALSTVQVVAGVLILFGGALLSGIMFVASASDALAAGLNAGGRAIQGAFGAVQGGLQMQKSDLIAKTETASSAVSAIEKASENDVDSIRANSEGAQKAGSSINAMVSNEGSITRQKII